MLLQCLSLDNVLKCLSMRPGLRQSTDQSVRKSASPTVLSDRHARWSVFHRRQKYVRYLTLWIIYRRHNYQSRIAYTLQKTTSRMTKNRFMLKYFTYFIKMYNAYNILIVQKYIYFNRIFFMYRFNSIYDLFVFFVLVRQYVYSFLCLFIKSYMHISIIIEICLNVIFKGMVKNVEV